MVQKLELIKGGGGSIKVGTTGTIGSLMTKELDSVKSTPPAPVSTRQKPSTDPISVSCDIVLSPKKIKPRRTVDDASSSGSSSDQNINYRHPESIQKARHDIRKKTHHVPMLATNGAAAVEITTPNRVKADKKGINIVEVVDIRCGHPDKWSANRFKKKLSFSKLSETIN